MTVWEDLSLVAGLVALGMIGVVLILKIFTRGRDGRDGYGKDG